MSDGVEVAKSILDLIDDLEKLMGSDINKDVQSTINALRSYGKENYNNVFGLVSQFDSIRNMELTEDEKTSILNQNLDRYGQFITPLDRKSYIEECKEDFPVVWELLDEDSKEFLITAKYLKYACKMMQINDYSPVILEFCRVFENELQKKIYVNFIDEMSSSTALIVDRDLSTESLKKAVKKKKSNKPYFISASEMLNYIEATKNVNTRSTGYITELKKYLISEKWDVIKITEKGFHQSAHSYVDRFRNKSAHPNVLSEDISEQCMQKTEKIVSQFISCKNV